MQRDTFLTPAQVAKQWGVGRNKVMSWINGGELAAINTALIGKMPRYRVDPRDLDAFKQTKLVPTTPKPQPQYPALRASKRYL